MASTVIATHDNDPVRVKPRKSDEVFSLGRRYTPPAVVSVSFGGIYLSLSPDEADALAALLPAAAAEARALDAQSEPAP